VNNNFFTRHNWYLLKELIRARFKCDDRNSALGLLWSLLDPAAMLAVMYFIFRTRFGQGVTYYPLHLLWGIILVDFFVATISKVTFSLLESREMLLNVHIPPQNIIIVDIFMSLYKFLIEIVVCLALSIYFTHPSLSAVLMLVPVLFFYIVMVVGASFVISILTCLASDISHIWSLCSRFFYIITPVFYSIDSISPLARKAVYHLNPLTPFLLSFQNILLGQGRIDGFTYLYCILLGSSFFIFGYWFFNRLCYFAIEKA